ncbi:DUF3422 family protein [Algirhabdus cladophorae]|uniref:DUF3422 family protein n=1 Tax=Algirhabdus cladophorae TaxID=3377108 RepID=UPI003B84ABE1
MTAIEDHPLRYPMANELHARPFPTLNAPCTATYLAIKQPVDAANRDRSQDMAHLVDLLDRYGAPHPQPGATHYFGKIGRHTLKWEQHTEFVTYTAFEDGLSDRPFDPSEFDVFPQDWLQKAPGTRMTSALIRVAERTSDDDIKKKLEDWFVPESLAVSRILDDCAVAAGDFRIDPAGHMRFAVFVDGNTGERRIGRIVQRLCEIETYKSISMLGLSRVRSMSGRMAELETSLTGLIANLTGNEKNADDTLQELLAISAELESLSARSSFRFGATGAYQALVSQRIEVLREDRFNGRQTFGEFMMRRFDPAMRTVASAQERLNAMTGRATRAGDLLRTRVDVERSAQNQTLLESMDKRADLQLRLQRTVEGLSVVAISYYALNLVLYVAEPFGKEIGLGKTWLGAIATPLVILGVWFAVRRIRKAVE